VEETSSFVLPVRASEGFNCRNQWSDAPQARCGELEFMEADSDDLERAFKVSLTPERC
jgi:hypothetical protein